MVNFIPLGTRGYIPAYNRRTMCFMIIGENDVILLDAGSGVARLLEPNIKSLIADKNALHVILSHYHLDHIVGLSFLPAVWQVKPIHIYAPASEYVDADPQSAIDTLLNPPLFPVPLNKFPNETELVRVKKSLQIGSLHFDFTKLNHDGGSMGLKINDKFSYITDTAPTPDYYDFIRGSKYLLHEVWFDDEETRPSDVKKGLHSSISEVVSIIKNCDIPMWIPAHFNPTWDEDKIQNVFKRFDDEKFDIIIPTEGKTYSLDL